MRPNMSRSAQFLWSRPLAVGSCVHWIWMKTEEEQTCQRLPLPDGINVAEESAGKRFKVEWDFQEERRKIKKFVNLGQRNLHLKRIETGN